MLTFLNLQPEIFGIDINDLSVRLVKLKKDRTKFSLESYGEVALRPGVIHEGVIDDQKALTRALRQVYLSPKGRRISTNHVAVSLPEEKSFSQVIKMPAMTHAQLEGAVPFEAENYIPLPIDKVYLDFQEISSQALALGGQIDVLINVMPKVVVDVYVDCIKRAGLEPRILEVESQAVARSLARPGSHNLPVIFIDFGQTKTSFIIYSGNSIRFTCSIPISSGQLTQAIAKNLGIDAAKAEALKIQHGMVTRKGDAKDDIVAAMDPILSDLAEQIKKYISFYQGHVSQEYFTSEGNIEKIVLCGGGANLHELPDFLHKKLRLPVEIGNPFANILPSPLVSSADISAKKALSYATAVGLAMRGAEASKEW